MAEQGKCKKRQRTRTPNTAGQHLRRAKRIARHVARCGNLQTASSAFEAIPSIYRRGVSYVPRVPAYQLAVITLSAWRKMNPNRRSA